MSSRALRRLQKERDEQKILEQTQTESDSEEERHHRPAVKPSAFALLESVDDEDVGASSDEDASGGIPVDIPDHSAKPPSTAAASSKKKRKKKKKGKAQVKTEEPDVDEDGEEIDEIDKALRSLATDGQSSQSGATSAGESQAVRDSNKLLAIDTTHLHAQNEMKRLFGRAVLDQDQEEGAGANAGPGGNRRQRNRLQQVGLAQALRGQTGAAGRSSGLAAVALRRNPFIQGKSEWPLATGGGLGMEIEEKRADGIVLYRFVHNRAYQDVQAQFQLCVESMDPNQMVALLRYHPYHISSLLQVSEFAKQERDPATSGDLLERALFSFGRALHSTFVKNLSEGAARLDFDRPENREFWLASWRYMQNLSMRATWRTVYEWAKLLLTLSPLEDPYAIWLILDHYALRAGQDLDYLNISRDKTYHAVHTSLPNVRFSQALAEFRAGNKSKGQQALFQAIGMYPWFAARLMQELAIDAPPAVWGKQAATERERLYAELYATRAKDLWNMPEAISLLTEVAAAVPPETPAAAPLNGEITRNEARHVLLSDTPALIALVPRKYTVAFTSMSDPLPPLDDRPSYTSSRSTPRNPVQQRATGNADDGLRELQGHYRFFSNLFPWFNRNNGASAEGGPLPEDLDENEFQRAIEESGVTEAELMGRAQRMEELRQIWLRGADPEQTPANETEEERRPHQATVEDGSDHDGDD